MLGKDVVRRLGRCPGDAPCLKVSEDTIPYFLEIFGDLPVSNSGKRGVGISCDGPRAKKMAKY